MSKNKNADSIKHRLNGITFDQNDISFSTSSDEISRRDWDAMKLFEKLLQLEKSTKMSAKDVAKKAKIPYSTYVEYRRAEKRQVDTTHLINLAGVFGITIDELLGVEQKTQINLKGLPTKKLFSRWVKLTIEDIDGQDDES